MRSILKDATHKFLVTAAALLLAAPLAWGAADEGRIRLSVGVGPFRATAASYRQLYGGTSFMPEIRLGRTLGRNLLLWGGCAWNSDDGVMVEVSEPARIRRTVLSLGAGYNGRLAGRLRWRAEAGLALLSFREEALGAVVKGRGLGWRLGSGIDWFAWDRVFIFLAAAFTHAGDDAETGRLRLGGLHLNGGMGFAF
jgi:hypothetical protein